MSNNKTSGLSAQYAKWEKFDAGSAASSEPTESSEDFDDYDANSDDIPIEDIQKAVAEVKAEEKEQEFQESLKDVKSPPGLEKNDAVTAFDEPQQVTFGGNNENDVTWTAEPSDGDAGPTNGNPENPKENGFTKKDAEAKGNSLIDTAFQQISNAVDGNPNPPANTTEDGNIKEVVQTRSGLYLDQDVPVPSLSKEELEEKLRKEKEDTIVERWTKNGAHVKEEKYEYYWSQDKTEVTLRIPVYDMNTKASLIDVKMDGKKLNLRYRKTKTSDLNHLLQGEFNFQVKVVEKIENYDLSSDDEGFDWELTDSGIRNSGFRLVVITLQKKVLAERTVYWINSPIKDHPEINVQEIEGRKINFQKNWDEAHTEFKKKIKNFKKVDIPV